MDLRRTVDISLHEPMEQVERSGSEAPEFSSYPGDATARTGYLIDLSPTISF